MEPNSKYFDENSATNPHRNHSKNSTDPTFINKSSGINLNKKFENIQLNTSTIESISNETITPDICTISNVSTNLNPDKKENSSIADNIDKQLNIINLCTVKENNCDIQSDTSSYLINSLSKQCNQNDEKKSGIVNDYEGIILPPLPLHPDTYLNFPHYIDYNSFSTNNYNNTNNASANNASSAFALNTNKPLLTLTTTAMTSSIDDMTTTITTTTANNDDQISDFHSSNLPLKITKCLSQESSTTTTVTSSTSSPITDDTVSTPIITTTINSSPSSNISPLEAFTAPSSILTTNQIQHNNPFQSPPPLILPSIPPYSSQLAQYQLGASTTSNIASTPAYFHQNLLSYKRYLFSPKTQSLDLGTELDHPLHLHRSHNPRLQQQHQHDCDYEEDNEADIEEEDDEIIVVEMDPTNNHNKNRPTNNSYNSSNGNSNISCLRRNVLQRNTDDAAFNNLTDSSILIPSTSNILLPTMPEISGIVCLDNSDDNIASDVTSSLLKDMLKPKIHTLDTRPIYPNVPYSPYASPFSSPRSNRRRIPLRESRRVSIDKTGSFLQLNQYKLMDQIGQGSYGLVKLAYNEEDSTHYAMKILSKRRLLRKAGLMGRGPKKTTQSPLDRVYREIAVLKKLDHPNVVKLIEVLDDPLEDFLYLVFELVQQGEILSIPTDKPLTEERAWSVFRDAVQGLEYLHYQRIIHADIKPGNLLLGECGRVKIADLGVCNEFLGEDATMNNGSTAGTPAFRAPETLIPGQHLYSGKAADIWALGATLWSLIYGSVPFVASNVPALYEKIKNEPLQFPDNPQICDELRDVLEKILIKDPSKRITLPQLKEHPWVTTNSKYPLASEEDNCRLVQISDEDINSVVKSIPKLDTLILIKTMLKNHSFQNPFSRGTGVSGRAPQRGGSRWERFTRAGRSNSAPGAYHSPLDRQLSSDNILPALTENVNSSANESSDKSP